MTGKQPITPYLVVQNGLEALSYYQSCLGAKLLDKMETPDGKLIHGSFKLSNGAEIMICDMEKPERMLQKGQLSPVSLSLSFKTYDEALSFWERFEKKNNESDYTIHMKFEPQFWGDNFGVFSDKYGHVWQIMSPLTKEQKIPQQPFEIKRTNNITGNKRTSIDNDDDNDIKNGEETSDEPPRKRQKLSHSNGSNSNNSNNSNNSSNDQQIDNIVDKSEKTGFKEILRDVEAKYGLFRSYTVGESGEVKDFGDAFKGGMEAVMSVIGDNNKLNSSKTSVIAISPDDPRVVKPARYIPGVLFDSSKISKEELLKLETDKVKVLDIAPSDWYIYLHCGSYDTITQSWHLALEDIKRKGLNFIDDDLGAYEMYLNDMSNTKIEDLRTLICIGIK